MDFKEIQSVLDAMNLEKEIAAELGIPVSELRKRLASTLIVISPARYRELVGAKPTKAKP